VETEKGRIFTMVADILSKCTSVRGNMKVVQGIEDCSAAATKMDVVPSNSNVLSQNLEDDHVTQSRVPL